VLLEPARRLHPDVLDRRVVERELRESEVPNRLAERVPGSRVPVELDEEAASRERAEDLGAVPSAQSVT